MFIFDKGAIYLMIVLCLFSNAYIFFPQTDRISGEMVVFLYAIVVVVAVNVTMLRLPNVVRAFKWKKKRPILDGHQNTKQNRHFTIAALMMFPF